jgi:hypothetical protein
LRGYLVEFGIVAPRGIQKVDELAAVSHGNSIPTDWSGPRSAGSIKACGHYAAPIGRTHDRKRLLLLITPKVLADRGRMRGCARCAA